MNISSQKTSESVLSRLLYQLLALIGEGIAVVISPHKALQVDEVTQLQRMGIAAAFLNSNQPKEERKAVLDGLSHIRLLYLAPEQLCCEDVREALTHCRVGRVAIDEAHILPEVQLGFRRAYGEIGEFIAILPWRPQVIACTATATPQRRKQILNSLGIPDADVFHAPVHRDNLHLEVKRVEGKGNTQYQSVERVLNKWQQAGKKERGSVIIYCTTVKDVKSLYKYLKARKWCVAKYTGKAAQKKRLEAQRAFMSDDVPIIVATSAFGLGINKPDVRLVIHVGLPLTMNDYVQEIGRAGRDGEAANFVLFYTKGDLGRNKHILTRGTSREPAC